MTEVDAPRNRAASLLLAEIRSLLDDPNTPDAAIGRALRAILTPPDDGVTDLPMRTGNVGPDNPHRVIPPG